jgi:hypothetical protein
MSDTTTFCRSAHHGGMPPPRGWHVAAVLGLACGGAVAEPQPTTDARTARHEQAQQAYGRGDYEAAFAEYCALADLGHAGAARTAAWMSCFGAALYGLELPLPAERLAAWRFCPPG